MMKMHASCVSHDMRAPLGAIDQIVEHVVSLPRMPKKVVRLLKPVKCASKILKTQVNNLLDYNLLQKKQFKLNGQKISISDVIEQLVKLMTP
jgi:K+-sensing histidine kinase KdpD